MNGTDPLKGIPSPGEMLEKSEFVDPSTGITITRLGPDKSGTWYSSITLNSNHGPIPINFEIPGVVDLTTARWHWRDAALTAARNFMKQLQDSQRRIVIPGELTAPFPRKPS